MGFLQFMIIPYAEVISFILDNSSLFNFYLLVAAVELPKVLSPFVLPWLLVVVKVMGSYRATFLLISVLIALMYMTFWLGYILRHYSIVLASRLLFGLFCGLLSDLAQKIIKKWFELHKMTSYLTYSQLCYFIGQIIPMCIFVLQKYNQIHKDSSKVASQESFQVYIDHLFFMMLSYGTLPVILILITAIVCFVSDF